MCLWNEDPTVFVEIIRAGPFCPAVRILTFYDPIKVI